MVINFKPNIFIVISLIAISAANCKKYPGIDKNNISKEKNGFEDSETPLNETNIEKENIENLNRFDYFRNTDNIMFSNANYVLGIKMGSFYGNEFSGYDIPFIGKSRGVKSITIDNKTHEITRQDDIFFRQTFKLPLGYVRIYFSVELTDGRIFEDLYLDTTLEQVPNSIDIDVK